MSDESGAYRSQLTLYGVEPRNLPAEIRDRAIFLPGPAPVVGQRLGEVTDAADPVLAALRAGVVLPVVASLLTGDELDELQLAWGAPPHERDAWVRLVARGEVFMDLLDSPDWDGGGDLDAATVAARLADDLQDWVCETAFAWGQLRPIEYTLPAP